MESSSLFNPGFLGSSFNWWVGQITDDDHWRDNIVPTKNDSPEGSEGWGYRYKVRIIGLHDQDDETLKSEELPWSQVMYPITGGGGQQASFQTPNLRQGNFVFGFFLDGSDMQVPVIMGVLGNNAKTTLRKTDVVNYEGASGYGRGSDPPPPDSGKRITEPQGDQNAEKEHSDAPHGQNASDVIGQEQICEKIPLKTPENQVQSSIKNMQTEIEKMTGKISKYMNSITSYTDAVTYRGQNPQILIKDASKVMAKYTKPIMDQMMSHAQKKLNDELTNVVSALPSSERYLFAEMKEEMNEMALCLYNGITNNLSNKLEGLLADALDIDNLIAQARGNASRGKQNAFLDGERPTIPEVPTCAAEDLMASVIVTNMETIQENNDTMLQGVNEFLNDISEKVSGVLGIADQVSKGLGILGALTQLPNINTSMGAAMLFNNLSLDVFGCEVKPNEAVSDQYTFCGGGSSQPDTQITDAVTEDQAVNNGNEGSPGTDPDPGFAGPTPATPDVRNDGKITPEELENNQTPVTQEPITQEPIPLTVEPFVEDTPTAPGAELPSSDRTTVGGAPLGRDQPIRTILDYREDPNNPGFALRDDDFDQTIKSELRFLEKELAEEKVKNPGIQTVKQSNLENYITTLKQSLTGTDDIEVNGRKIKAGDTMSPAEVEAINRFKQGQSQATSGSRTIQTGAAARASLVRDLEASRARDAARGLKEKSLRTKTYEKYLRQYDQSQSQDAQDLRRALGLE